ncbi:MAG: hypothetical protein AB7G80_01045 [Dongiaceae bacterium]
MRGRSFTAMLALSGAGFLGGCGSAPVMEMNQARLDSAQRVLRFKDSPSSLQEADYARAFAKLSDRERFMCAIVMAHAVFNKGVKPPYAMYAGLENVVQNRFDESLAIKAAHALDIDTSDFIAFGRTAMTPRDIYDNLSLPDFANPATPGEMGKLLTTDTAFNMRAIFLRLVITAAAADACQDLPLCAELGMKIVQSGLFNNPSLGGDQKILSLFAAAFSNSKEMSPQALLYEFRHREAHFSKEEYDLGTYIAVLNYLMRNGGKEINLSREQISALSSVLRQNPGLSGIDWAHAAEQEIIAGKWQRIDSAVYAAESGQKLFDMAPYAALTNLTGVFSLAQKTTAEKLDGVVNSYDLSRVFGAKELGLLPPSQDSLPPSMIVYQKER